MSKVMVSLPEELLQRIDEEARRRSMSRSALLAAAAQRELARSDPAAVADAITRSERRFRTAGSFEAADLIRRDRDPQSVTTLLVDTSVLVKWFHHEGESGLTEARLILDSTRRGDVEARVIDLALYEMGNVLLRGLGWDGSDVADQLDDLVIICGPPLAMTAEWFRRVVAIGAAHHLTFYDAAWAAAAEALGVSLVSADLQLLTAGLAESPAYAARRLRL